MTSETPPTIEELKAAEALMRKLNQAIPAGGSQLGAAEGDPFVELAQGITRAHPPRPTGLPPGAQQRIEARLRARFAEVNAAPPAHPPRGRIRLTQLGPFLRIAAILLIVSSLFFSLVLGAERASASSLPGDALYPVKLRFEDVRLAVSSDAGDVDLRLKFAARRVNEFNALFTEQDSIHPASLAAAADELDSVVELLEAANGDPVVAHAAIVELTENEEPLWDQVETTATPEEWEQVQAAVEDILEARERSAALLLPRETQESLVTATPTYTPTPTATMTATPTPTGTLTLTPEAAGESSEIERAPTRTPPGHGATPGLGQNPPGQGGDNPGIGNDGNPPGQQDKPRNSGGNGKK